MMKDDAQLQAGIDTMSADSSPSLSPDWPREIRVTEKGRRLSVHFADGQTSSLSATLLRTASPSAEARRAPPDTTHDVAIVGIEAVGNYAVQIAFDDGHKSGIYSWDLLRSLISRRD